MKLIQFAFFLASICAVASLEQGLTRIESYRVNMTIDSRFAQTSVFVDFVNELDCATILGLTLQLPFRSRVTDLTLQSENGCEWDSQVEPLEEAQDIFDEAASEGKPAALLSAWDSSNYAVQVSLPPLGTTSLEIRYEEVLRRQQYQVPFQIPLFPGLPVNELVMDLYVNEPTSGIDSFDLDPPPLGSMNIVRDANNVTVHYELGIVSDGDALPRLLRGYYDPGPLPEEGLLLSDGTCFTHFFNPASLIDIGPLNRNIVFVIDVSGSMSGQKLADAKAAFSAMIETLTENDYFSIQSFSDQGIEDDWGPQLATAQAKESASNFVLNLQSEGSTNLHDAYIFGIEKALSSWEGESYLPILMILTDGQATTGIQSSIDISRNVKALNNEGRVKIFALAFGEGADLPLLLGISIQNGGLAVPIYEGYGDASSQMEDFYNGELGSILLSDINIMLSSEAGFESETQTSFPVLAAGAEIAVRGLLSSSTTSETTLRASTTAVSAMGPTTWNTDVVLVPGDSVFSRECYQSFANAKITELLNFRDGAISLGDELEEYIDFYSSDQRQGNLGIVERVEAEALSLALDAGLVWPGLTAMVTGDPTCPPGVYDFSESEELCYDGDAFEPEDDGSEYGDDTSYGSGNMYTSGGVVLPLWLSGVCLFLSMLRTAM